MPISSNDSAKPFLERTFNVTAPQATVIAAAVALLSGAIGAFITGWSTHGVETTKVSGQLDLERLKFQTSLVLKAIETPDQENAVKTLKFFARAGLIPAYEKKVLELATEDQGSAVPVLRYRQLSDTLPGRLREMARSVGKLEMVNPVRRWKEFCTAILLKNNIGLTIGHCRADDSATLTLGEDDASGPTRYRATFIGKADSQTGAGMFRIDGDAIALFGGMPLKTRAPRIGELVAMIHYPLGGAPRVSMDGCFVIAVDESKSYGLRYHCKTEPGSTGAPIISLADFSILGIHAAAVVDDPGGNLKDGLLISRIMAVEKELPVEK